MKEPIPNGTLPPMVRALAAFIRDVGFPVFVATYLLLQVATIGPQVSSIAASLKEIATSQTRILFLLERR